MAYQQFGEKVFGEELRCDLAVVDVNEDTIRVSFFKDGHWKDEMLVELHNEE